ncbi:hypothetical protein PanWU01x14_059620, partial [Parasponia andersonii]
QSSDNSFFSLPLRFWNGSEAAFGSAKWPETTPKPFSSSSRRIQSPAKNLFHGGDHQVLAAGVGRRTRRFELFADLGVSFHGFVRTYPPPRSQHLVFDRLGTESADPTALMPLPNPSNVTWSTLLRQSTAIASRKLNLRNAAAGTDGRRNCL